MFSILSIEIERFKAFATYQKLIFPSAPGLYFVTGQNNVSPRLGSNGVGKSTILDAIVWCLYGRTVRGLKASDVVSWSQKRATVTLKLVIGGYKYTISRSQSPNSLTIDNRPADQEAVSKVLRVNADGFLSSVIRPQFGDGFLSLKPADKLTLFSQVMELDLWLERAKLASTLVAEFESDIQRDEWNKSNLESQIKTVLADIDAWKGAATKFESEREERVTARKEYLASLEDAVTEADDKQTDYAIEAAKLNEERGRWDQKLDRHADALEVINKRSALLDAKIFALVAAGREASNELNMMPHVGATCPHCRQQVGKEHFAAEQKRLQKEIKSIEKLKTGHHEEAQRIAVAKQKLFKDIAHAKHQRLEAEAKRNTLSNKLASLRQQITSSEQTIADARSVLKKAIEDLNPYIGLISQKTVNLKALRASKATTVANIQQMNTELAAVKPWVTGFKKVRLYIVDQTLKQLEIEINNNLASLGMPDWTITLDVERENKAGGLTKGFVVFVHVPKHDKPVRFEAWSGGETQRLCLAGDMGLSNLIMLRAGLMNDIEFYDEPSARLSAEGLNDLAETLAERAEMTNKRIFLIDHHIMDFGRFAGTIRVIKDGKGSSITASS